MKNTSSLFKNKVDAFESTILSNNVTDNAPTNVRAFAIWEDEAIGVKKISKSVIYEADNQHLRKRLDGLLALAKNSKAALKDDDLGDSIHLKKKLKKMGSLWAVERDLHHYYRDQVANLEASRRSLMEELSRSQGKVVRLHKDS